MKRISTFKPPVARATLVALVALSSLGPLEALAIDHGTYTLSRESEKLNIQSSKYGKWTGPGILGGKKDSLKSVQRLSFEFSTEDYFTPENKGHFAVGLQGHWEGGLHGRGVVIGNVSELAREGKCAPAPRGHRVVIEGFHGQSNCVYGLSSASIPLMNGEHYRLEVVSEGRLVSYRLEQKVGERWHAVSNASVFDEDGQEVAGGQWWVGEVFSPKGWQMKFFNVKED